MKNESFPVHFPLYSLQDVSLDVAENRQTGQERAYPVEQCNCPRGYRGLSCEDCDIGYRRSGGGLYLGTCEECTCYGHSTDCDTSTGLCRVSSGRSLLGGACKGRSLKGRISSGRSLNGRSLDGKIELKQWEELKWKDLRWKN